MSIFPHFFCSAFIEISQMTKNRGKFKLKFNFWKKWIYAIVKNAGILKRKSSTSKSAGNSNITSLNSSKCGKLKFRKCQKCVNFKTKIHIKKCGKVQPLVISAIASAKTLKNCGKTKLHYSFYYSYSRFKLEYCGMNPKLAWPPCKSSAPFLLGLL